MPAARKDHRRYPHKYRAGAAAALCSAFVLGAPRAQCKGLAGKGRQSMTIDENANPSIKGSACDFDVLSRPGKSARCCFWVTPFSRRISYLLAWRGKQLIPSRPVLIIQFDRKFGRKFDGKFDGEFDRKINIDAVLRATHWRIA